MRPRHRGSDAAAQVKAQAQAKVGLLLDHLQRVLARPAVQRVFASERLAPPWV